MRIDGRADNQLRPLNITPGFMRYAEGSALFEMGDTRVICTASIENKVPPFLKDTGQGWVTAEYNMLPRSTVTRKTRESSIGKTGGRTHEIQRLIGRCLRTVVNLESLGERTVWVDCDVIQADGGTRTAAINGSFIALAMALRQLKEKQNIRLPLLNDCVAAVSLGIVENKLLLDLNFAEDSSAQTDMNVVMTGTGDLIEIQGTAEKKPFSQSELTSLLQLAREGVREINAAQQQILGFSIPF